MRKHNKVLTYNQSKEFNKMVLSSLYKLLLRLTDNKMMHSVQNFYSFHLTFSRFNPGEKFLKIPPSPSRTHEETVGF